MILLDTNVLSALMRREPEARVVEWLDAQPPESVWTTSITVFEIRFGLGLLADGRKRELLESAFAKAIDEDFEGRVAVFDRPAAEAAGEIAARGRRTGRPVDVRDIQIAGIARSRKAVVATRNRRHFEGLGIEVIDPWSV